MSTELFYRILSSAEVFHGFPTLKRIVFPRAAKCTRSSQLPYQSPTLLIQVDVKFYKHMIMRSLIPRPASNSLKDAVSTLHKLRFLVFSTPKISSKAMSVIC